MTIGQAYLADLKVNREVHDRQISLIMSRLPSEDSPYGSGEEEPQRFLQLDQQLRKMDRWHEWVRPEGGDAPESDDVPEDDACVAVAPRGLHGSATPSDAGPLSLGSVLQQFVATIRHPPDVPEGSAEQDHAFGRSSAPPGVGPGPPSGG